MASRSGAEILEKLLEHIEGTYVDYAYVDEDEDGKFLGIVLIDDEEHTEYHLTLQQNGYVQLAAGPEEGETLDEVMDFNLAEVEEPFSNDGVEGE